MNKYHTQYIVSAVLRDWCNRRIEKLRDSLPPNFTSSTLRAIQRQAIYRPNIAENDAKSDTEWNAESAAAALGIAGGKHTENGGPLSRPVSVGELERILFGQDQEGRLWRRYANSVAPMQPYLFTRAIVRAWENGWLGFWQMVSILTWIQEYEAANTVLRKFLKRISKRTPPKSATDQSVQFRRAFEDYVTPEALDEQVRKSVDVNAAFALKRLDRLPLDPEVKDWCRHI